MGTLRICFKYLKFNVSHLPYFGTIYVPIHDVPTTSYAVSQDIGLRPYMVNVYIKERINDQTTICARGEGGFTSNPTYLGARVCGDNTAPEFFHFPISKD